MLRFVALMTVLMMALAGGASAAPVELLHGNTLAGWEGPQSQLWHMRGSVLTGGKLGMQNPRTTYLCTEKEFGNFELSAEFKLEGTKGRINSGIQFRSLRMPNATQDVVGYQADMGKDYWGSLYDQSRRNKTLMAPNQATALSILKPGDWNTCKVRCEGPHIQIWTNGLQTVDYTETDPTIPQRGVLGLQLHGGGDTQVSFRNMVIEELPATPVAEWQNLFNGSDLTGWKYEGGEPFNGKTAANDGRFSAKDGAIVANPRKEGAPRIGKLWTAREFSGDFELRLEFRAAVNADSGIFILKPQLQCRDYLVAGPYRWLKQYKPQEWNQITVVARGGVARCMCNGELLEYTLKLPEKGPIGLEADREQMEYRNIQIKLR